MNRGRFWVVVASVVIGLGSWTPAAEAAIRRVKAGCSSSCDGSSWASAYTYLRDAIAASSNGDEIWVAAGTYYPDECVSGCTNGDRSATFTISNPAVHVYGGFAGTETARSERNPATNVTILSGDIDQDSTLDGDNSYHVVTYSTASASATLDGFTVTMGYANGASHIDEQGAAIQIRSAAVCIAGGPTINDCIITNNYSADHGAVNDHALASTFTNCTFTDNSAPQGAALLVEHGSPTIFDCTFEDNTADVSGCQMSGEPGQGAAIWLGRRTDDGSCTGASAPVITGCTFINNVAEQGGAIWSNDSSPTIEDCEFLGNTASADCSAQTQTVEGQGGAIWASQSSEMPVYVRVHNCDFGDAEEPGSDYNSAAVQGGAIRIEGYTASYRLLLVLENSRFYGSRTTRTPSTGALEQGGGGALWTKRADCVIEYSTFVNNDAPSIMQGGAIYAYSGSVDAIHTTFFGNTVAKDQGAAVYHESGELGTATSVWTNCLFSGNVAGEDGCDPCGASGPAIRSTPPLTLINCTIANNQVLPDTGGSFSYAVKGGTITAHNTIFWNELYDSDEAEVYGGNVTLTNCVVRGGSAGVVGTVSETLTNCLTTDPEFQDDDGTDNLVGTEDDNLRPASTSDCIDAGTNTPVNWDFDLDRERRIANSTIDIGAYEFCDESSCADEECAEALCSNTTGNCGFIEAGDLPCDGGLCCDGLFCTAGDCCAGVDCDSGEVCCGNSCTEGACCDDVDCNAPTPYCSSNECVECESPAHCASGEVCCGGVCYTGTCCPGSGGCGIGKICCEYTYTCTRTVDCSDPN